MAELNALSVPAYNPDNTILTPARPLGAILKMRQVTPSDTADLPEFARGFKVGTTGTVAFMGWDGVIVSDPGAYVAGVFHWIACKRILSTGTTATQIMWGN